MDTVAAVAGAVAYVKHVMDAAEIVRKKAAQEAAEKAAKDGAKEAAKEVIKEAVEQGASPSPMPELPPTDPDPKKPQNLTSNDRSIPHNARSIDHHKLSHLEKGSKGHDHKWKEILSEVTPEKIREIVTEVMETGEQGITPYSQRPCFRKEINGRIVEVTYAIVDGIRKIGSAWVK